MTNVVRHITTGYSPRPIQLYLHQAVRRFNVLVCHRRFGKTVFSLNEMIDRGLRNQRKNPQYAYIAPTYGQAKRVAWDYLKEFTKNIPGVVVNEAELRVDIPRPHMGDRVRFILLGAENPGSLRGIYLDGVLLDEYAEMDPTIWSQVVRPALSDRLGWAIFIGTPKGQNHFFDIFTAARKQMLEGDPDWFAAVYKASETHLIEASELQAAKVTMTPEEFDQEFECSFSAALVGAYYGKEMAEAERENRIGKVPYDKSVPVQTYWDLGMSDHTAIWFVQRVGKEKRIIRYFEDTGRDLVWYFNEIKKFGYSYSRHVFPHDVEVRELTTGKSRREVAEQHLGRQYVEVNAKHNPEDRINAVRMTLGTCWFDEINCHKGILALKSYERKWDAKNKIYLPKPLHNWASHGADAFGEFAFDVRGDRAPEYRSQLPQRTNNQYDIFKRRKR